MVAVPRFSGAAQQLSGRTYRRRGVPMCGSGKRLIPIAAVVLAATAALLGPVPEAVDASFGRGTTEHKVIARDDKIFGLWAVGDTVLYGRSAKRRRWMRVV